MTEFSCNLTVIISGGEFFTVESRAAKIHLPLAFDQMDYVPLYRCLFPSMPMFKVHRMSGLRSLLGGSQSSSQSNTLSGVSAMLLLTATQKFRAEFLIICLHSYTQQIWGRMSILWFKKMATPADWKTLLGDGPLTKKQHIVKVLHTLICEWLVSAFEHCTQRSNAARMGSGKRCQFDLAVNHIICLSGSSSRGRRPRAPLDSFQRRRRRMRRRRRRRRKSGR